MAAINRLHCSEESGIPTATAKHSESSRRSRTAERCDERCARAPSSRRDTPRAASVIASSRRCATVPDRDRVANSGMSMSEATYSSEKSAVAPVV